MNSPSNLSISARFQEDTGEVKLLHIRLTEYHRFRPRSYIQALMIIAELTVVHTTPANIPRTSRLPTNGINHSISLLREERSIAHDHSLALPVSPVDNRTHFQKRLTRNLTHPNSTAVFKLAVYHQKRCRDDVYPSSHCVAINLH